MIAVCERQWRNGSDGGSDDGSGAKRKRPAHIINHRREKKNVQEKKALIKIIKFPWILTMFGVLIAADNCRDLVSKFLKQFPRAIQSDGDK